MAVTVIHTCDMCDSVINTDNITRLSMAYPKSQTEGEEHWINYDLCPKCAAKISNYLRNFKEDYNAKE